MASDLFSDAILIQQDLATRTAAGTRKIPSRHVCDTCRQKCKGGCLDYVSVRSEHRHGCTDHQACARAWLSGRSKAAT